MSTLIAPFDVTGPTKRLTWVRSMLASLDSDVDPKLLLPRTCPLIFGDVKFLPGTHDRAAGYTLGGPTLRVRHGMSDAANLSKDTTEYVIAHEGFGHGRMAERPLTKEQWARCLALVKGPTGTDYWSRDLEVIIDAMVEAISGIESPYKHDPAKPDSHSRYKRWIDEADRPTLKGIWLEGLAAPPPVPVPVPEPDPLPPPPDLVAENAALKARLAELADLATKPVGIAGG